MAQREAAHEFFENDVDGSRAGVAFFGEIGKPFFLRDGKASVCQSGGEFVAEKAGE